MRLLVTFAAFAGAPFGLSARAQDVFRAETAQRSSPAALVIKIKNEAAKVESAKLSRLFTAVASPEIQKELGLDRKQIDLARQLEQMTREIIKDWLLRGLDTNPPPLPAVLTERLSERGDRLRARLVAHAEAIVLQAILTEEQARRYCRATGRKPEPLLAGRFGPPGPSEVGPNLPVSEDVRALQSAGYTCKRGGPVLLILLGWPGMREAYPNGVGHLDALSQRMARLRMPKVELPKQQADLIARIDELTLGIWRAWLTRDLDTVPLPPQRVLAERLASREPLRESLFGHTEAIVLEGVATPDQADRCLRIFWQMSGMNALLDPGLASRLRLSRSQREELLLLFQTKERVAADDANASRPPGAVDARLPEVKAWFAQAARVARSHQDEIDALIWEVLTTSQARALERILDGPKQPPRRPAGKAKKPSRPG